MSGDERLGFYYYPRACSLAPHIALEESGLPFEPRLVDIRPGKDRDPTYLALSPSGTVPGLLIAGSLLTETHAILTWIADQRPDLGLLPPTGDALRYRAHEWMNFLSSSVHVYVRSIFRPSAYAGDDAGAGAVVAEQGVRSLAKAVATVERRLEGMTWALGERYSVADAYLFVMYLWTTDERISHVPPRPRWDAVAERVWQRPATRRAVALERRHRDYPVPSHWAS